MPLQLAAPLYETFTLDKADEKYGTDGTPTTVTIKQATQQQHEIRQSTFDTMERKFSQLDPSEVSLVQRFAIEELKRLEVRLTLCECNLLGPEGKPLFRSKEKDGKPKLDMSVQEFDQAWWNLFPDIANEIHEKVLAVNPLWGGDLGEDS